MKVLVTGGSRGIGLETARLFREKGAEVWICGKNPDRLRVAASELNADSSAVDLGNPAEIAKLYSEIETTWGTLDVLINNAAEAFLSLVEHTEYARFERLFRVNVLGLVESCRKAIPLLRKGQSPAIVNVSSIAGIQGPEKFPGFSAYTASKAAVIGFSDVLARELLESGIRVNSISPGAVDTDMLRENVKGVEPAMTAREVGQAIYFLATDVSRPMVGRNLELF